jgi:hypothetical protein
MLGGLSRFKGEETSRCAQRHERSPRRRGGHSMVVTGRGPYIRAFMIQKHCGWLEYYQSKTRVSCILYRDTSKLNRDTSKLNRDVRKSNAPPGI